MMADAPRVFLSYSRDTDEHARRVLDLADALRHGGLEVILDQYVHPAPDEGWPHWMDRRLDEATFVLMVCTETYRRRIMGQEQPGKGLGIRWEGSLIYNRIYNDKPSGSRFIPVLFEGGESAHIPNPVQGHTYYLIHHFDLSDAGYEGLYRHLTGQAPTPPREIGAIQLLPPRPRLVPSGNPRDRGRMLEKVRKIWTTGFLKKLCSSLVLDEANVPGSTLAATAEPLVIVLEKYRDSTPNLNHLNNICVEIFFSLKNTGTEPVTVYDLGLQQVDAGAVAQPIPHQYGCRITLDASLAKKGENGEAIPLFSAWCDQCYHHDVSFSFEPLTPERAHDAMLKKPFRHEERLLFHSVIGDDKIITLAPLESESFLLRLQADPGCATVATQFMLCALYHDSRGQKRAVLSSHTYAVQIEKCETFVRLITGS